MTRAPSPPPELPGFTYVRPLGTGGFADVFLYEQQLPKREVAVKVLLADRLTAGAAEEFTNEANVMALLSTHPAIVTIYQAGVAADGRPYLVMEYCPKPNLQIRTRKEPFSVAEALRVGVQVSGAVETAHRAGVLHRDIKPANILVTAYNRPALTDFGIASTTASATDSEAAGMSIPWSPPESFAETPSTGVRTDVYALGATVYTLLSGRSPFERKGERNTSADLIERIERMAVPSLGRADVPDSLQATLARAMSKRPDDRYPSAVAFARALQKVQIELAHSVTPIDIVDEHPQHEGDDDDDDGLTRVREVRSINPDTQSATRPSATTLRKQPHVTADVPRFESAPAPSELEETQRRDAPASAAPATAASSGVSEDDEPTLLRRPRVVAPDAPPARADGPAPAAPSLPDEPHARKRSGMPWWGWVVSALGVVAVVLGIIFSGAITDALVPEPEPTTADTPRPQDPIAGIVPPVEDLKGSSAGGVVSFSWTNPDPEEGDSFVWYEVTLDGAGEPRNTAEDAVTLEGARSERTCIEVVLKRDDGRSSPQPVRGCVG